MNNIDYLGLDGRSLRVLLTVLEQGSVSAAARHLGLTQSAVSHTLDKLRAIIGDPLFVRAGRGVVPTTQAEALAPRVRRLLDELRGLTEAPAFEPERANLTITIAANDFQRDLLLPPLFQRLTTQAPGIRLRVIPSGMPAIEMLREDHCMLLLTPMPPDGPDIIQKRLLADELVCFYDSAVQAAPTTAEAYYAARHVGVVFGSDERNVLEERLFGERRRRNIVITVPNFAGIPPFLRGSDMVATLPSLMRYGLMQTFAVAPIPIPMQALPLYMAWHRRSHHDPMHEWIRGHLEAIALSLSDGSAGN